MLIKGPAGLEERPRPICVVGAGPVGLALVTHLARKGIPVLLLESGGSAADSSIQALAGAELVDPACHDDLMIATARRLGGTSNLWGARCLPFDPIDFAARPYVDARWPIDYHDLAPWIGQAAIATRSGAPKYNADEPLLPSGVDADDFSCDSLERWANVQAAQRIHAEAIANDPLIEVRSHSTLVGIRFGSGGAAEAVEVAHSLTGERASCEIGRLVIAAGGLESARILLATRREAPGRFGGEDGPLGRHYMGHVIGEIADIVFAARVTAQAFDYFVDKHGSYARRRIVAAPATQMDHALLNTAFWPVVPQLADPRHGSAILSLVYLALTVGPLARRIVAEAVRRRHVPPQRVPWLRHVVNLITGAPSACFFAADFLRKRHDKRTRLPGLFLLNEANCYGLSYHAEQAPNPDSRVTLSGAVDRLGLPSLRIDYRFSAQDIESVVRTHDLMERWLARTGLGRLCYRTAREERGNAVLRQAVHGTHQIGLVRMGAHAREGVVDAELRSFDAPNLYVVSTAVLPTSGQANPTLTTVALACRLADRLAAECTASSATTTSTPGHKEDRWPL